MDDLEEQSDVEEAEERGEERGGKAGQPVRKLLAMRGEPNLKHKDGSFNDIRRDGHVLDLCPRSVYLPVYLYIPAPDSFAGGGCIQCLVSVSAYI